MKIKYTKRNTVNQSDVDFLQATGLPRYAAELLVGRGILTKEGAARFLNPKEEDFDDPFLFPDMAQVVERVERAIQNKERIVVYADYDCDGVCAAAILYGYLKGADGGDVYYYIPTRKEGYGLHTDAIDKIAESVYPDLLITVDCGVTSVDEIEYAKDLGIDVIVTDHHVPREVLPDALILNPKVSDYPTELCGAGVAFKLVYALAGYGEAKKYIDLAAIATVGDIVPLVGENRTLAFLGLNALNGNAKRKGLKMLLDSVKLERVTAADLAFTIVPRLNAAGRMGLADRALELLISEDRFDIECLIKELNADNAERQVVLSDIADDVREKLIGYDLDRRRAIVLSDPRYDGGVLGIACSKIAGEFKRPTVLFTESGGVLKGSARSIEGVNLYEAMLEASDLFIAFGGHSQAAGASLKAENLAEFEIRLEKALQKYDEGVFAPEVFYDIMLSETPTEKELAEVLKLEPFGEGNPRPIFLRKAEKMNFTRIKGGEHIKMSERGTEIVGFSKRRYLELLNSPVEKYLTMYAEQSSFQGRSYTKLLLQGVFSEPQEGALDLDTEVGRYLFFDGAEKVSAKKQAAEACTAQNSAQKQAAETLTERKNGEAAVKRFEKGAWADIIEQTETIYGTVFLAFSSLTAKRFYDEFHAAGEKLLICSYGTAESPNPYNRLILSPKCAPPPYYKRIVYLDRPLNIASIGNTSASEVFYTAKESPLDTGTIGNTSLREVFRATEENPLDAVLRAEPPTDDTIRRIYVKIRAAIQSGIVASDARDFFEKVFKDGTEKYIDFLIAFSIFKELDFIRIDDGFRLTLTDKKGALKESEIYRKLKIES
ncbi:MAG: single-stranded-DNA-specific exonuclease RecJ [Clostridiales bacterium]|nr:single-stranded-DNA-specific exonuclease RecJ [Clostridiales bacterium]